MSEYIKDRVCTKCKKESFDTPCPHCGHGVFHIIQRPKRKIGWNYGHVMKNWSCVFCGMIDEDTGFRDGCKKARK